LLLRAGEVLAARERFYNAIEIDEDFVEARASLGCVLADTGQVDLAIAAFEGALAKDDHYPDVHYHLARSLDEIGNTQEATKHWLRFLQLSPQSPWADEALERLGRI
jgi:tetratricopeptide (TPR) repeat protein